MMDLNEIRKMKAMELLFEKKDLPLKCSTFEVTGEVSDKGRRVLEYMRGVNEGNVSTLKMENDLVKLLQTGSVNVALEWSGDSISRVAVAFFNGDKIEKILIERGASDAERITS